MKEIVKSKKRRTPNAEELEELMEILEKVKLVVNDEPQHALTLCENYLFLAKLHRSKEHIIESNYWFGVTHNSLGNYALAITYYSNSHKQNVKKKFVELYDRTLISLGVSYRQIGNYIDAIGCYSLSLENKNNVYLDVVYNNMGVIYFNINELDKSVECFQNAYEIYEKNGKLIFSLGVLNNIGRIKTIQKKYKESESVLIRAGKIAEENGLKIEVLTAKFNLAHLKCHLNYFEVAYELLLECIALLKKYYNRQLEFSIVFLIAKVSKELGNLDEATQFYERSLISAKSISRIELIKCLNEYSIFLNEQKKYKLASHHLKTVVYYNRQYNSNSTLQELNKQRVLFEIKERELRVSELKQVTKINEQLCKKEKLVKARNIVLENAVNALTEGQLLRSQMNPHFIYNSLNSISALLKKQENDKAMMYLLVFSKLMRDIYNNSTREKITLFEELAIVRCYFEMELLRFGQLFSYEFCIQSQIDENNFYVPPMILQPIVENAIKHGIFQLDPTIIGSIRIEITTTRFQNSQILGIKIDVYDNGIGIKKHRNFLKSLKQDSALLITQRRLANFNNEFGRKQYLKFKSLKPHGCLFSIRVKSAKV